MRLAARGIALSDAPFDFSKVKLAVATPTRSHIHVDCAGSIYSLIAQSFNKLAGVGFMSSRARTCPEARTELVHDFLHRTNATHMLCVDGDVEFQSNTVFEMLALNLPVVGCSYKGRGDSLGMYNYNVEVLPGPKQAPEKGCIKVSALGLGFTLFQRAPLEAMTKHYASDLAYTQATEGGRKFTSMVALFHEPIRSGTWFGEDFAFFYRWREMGGDVWLYLDAPLVHHVEEAKSFNALDHLSEFIDHTQTKSMYWPHGDKAVPCDAWHPEILGWSDDILPWYRSTVEYLPVTARCVEVGCYLGRSLAFLASELARQGKTGACVWGVDPGEAFDTEGTAGLPVERIAASRGGLLNNLASTVGERGTVRVEPLAERSLDAASHFEDRSLDLVFLDGDHRHEAIRADIEAWRPKVKVGGWLAGHDYTEAFPGVPLAVNAAFGTRVHIHETVWSVRISVDD